MKLKGFSGPILKLRLSDGSLQNWQGSSSCHQDGFPWFSIISHGFPTKITIFVKKTLVHLGVGGNPFFRFNIFNDLWKKGTRLPLSHGNRYAPKPTHRTKDIKRPVVRILTVVITIIIVHPKKINMSPEKGPI